MDIQYSLFDNIETGIEYERIEIKSFTVHYIHNRVHPIQPFEIIGLSDSPVEFKFALSSNLFVYLKEKNKIFLGKKMFALSIYKGIKNMDPDWRRHFTLKGTKGDNDEPFVRGLTDEDVEQLDNLVLKLESKYKIEL